MRLQQVRGKGSGGNPVDHFAEIPSNHHVCLHDIELAQSSSVLLLSRLLYKVEEGRFGGRQTHYYDYLRG